jgi:hypothetical protein
MGMTTDTQVRLHTWPGMRLTWMGAGAVVHSGDEPGSGAASLVVTPHGSSECAVVVSSHNVNLHPEMVEELADILANGLPRGFASMRFVAWDGACASEVAPAPAHILSMRLGIDVISAGGPLLGVPGGSLFTPVGRGPERPGGWWRFRAGTPPMRVGWRFPAPKWEADLPEICELGGDLVLDPVPAGLWLHRRNVSSVSDLAYSVPTDPEHPALILSHPSEEPLQRDEIVQGIGVIPIPMTEKLVLTPYGRCPVADGEVGPMVADMLGRAVHVRTGLPLCAPAGQRAVVTIDDKGLPRWRTFARELWHAPRALAPRTIDWINPAPEVLTRMAGAATFSLGAGWVCEVIQAGLWVRPEELPDPAEWVRGLPVDVNRCAIVLGAPHAPEITPPRRMIAGVLEQMPVDARKRAYLAVPRGAAPNVFVLAKSLRDRLPDTSEVELLGPSAADAADTAMFAPLTVAAGTARSDYNSLATVPSNPIVTAGMRAPQGYQRDMSHTERLDLPLPPSPHRNGPHNRQHEPRHGTPLNDFASPHTPLPPGMPQVPVTPTDYAGTPHTPLPPGMPPVRDYATQDYTAPMPAVRDYGAPMAPHTPVPPGMPMVNGYGPGQAYAPAEYGSHTGEHRTGDIAAHRTGDINGHRTGDIAAHRTGDIVGHRTGDIAGHRTGDIAGHRTGDIMAPRPGDFGSAGDYGPPNDYVEPEVPRVAAPPIPSEAMNPMAMNPMTPHTPGPPGVPMMPPAGYNPPMPAQPPVDYNPPMAPVDYNQAMPPVDYNQAMPAQAPVDYNQAMPAQAPVDYNQAMAPVDYNQAMPPADYNQAMPPADYNQAMAPVDYNQAMPPADYNQAMPIQPPTEFMPPAMPEEPQRPAPVGEETTGSIRAKEIRSHRTGNKPAKREDDRTNTQELDRLLGFFDEIRRAKAWDEQPQPEQTPHKRGGTRTATRKRR